ncbi:MAG: DUF874 domain-containing protein [Rhodobacteraceae bacterium]|jgi:uncharacterized protein involved in exopolysaccharide biosynthesis|nr:DUF874 domain-containing protein [Paracoccaceae bacterium]
MGPIHSFSDIVDMLRRRIWIIVVLTVIGALFSLWFASQQQHLYRSSEVIQITQPKIAEELANSTVAGSSARRLQLIQQRLMARANVLEVIEKFGLYADHPDQAPSTLVQLLRGSVSIEGVAAARQGFADDGTISVLTISAEMPTPRQAQLVAHEFAQRTIELSVSSRIEKARETLTFFAGQEAAILKDLTALEDEVARFRNANDLTLTGSVEFRRTEIASINEALLDIAREEISIQRAAQRAEQNERPATAQRMLAEADEQLATLEAQKQLLARRKNELESALGNTPEVERQLGIYERQLEQTRAELEDMRSRRSEAEVGFRLETARQSEQLMVIEPASLPDYPFTNSRKKLAIMGAIASILGAVGVAFLVELFNPVLRSSAQMERETGLKPAIVLPVLDTRPKRSGIVGRLKSLFAGRMKKPNGA